MELDTVPFTPDVPTEIWDGIATWLGIVDTFFFRRACHPFRALRPANLNVDYREGVHRLLHKASPNQVKWFLDTDVRGAANRVTVLTQLIQRGDVELFQWARIRAGKWWTDAAKLALAVPANAAMWAAVKGEGIACDKCPFDQRLQWMELPFYLACHPIGRDLKPHAANLCNYLSAPCLDEDDT